jgi:hypothetical protein
MLLEQHQQDIMLFELKQIVHHTQQSMGSQQMLQHMDLCDTTII